jgi:hypothetical protein
MLVCLLALKPLRPDLGYFQGIQPIACRTAGLTVFIFEFREILPGLPKVPRAVCF